MADMDGTASAAPGAPAGAAPGPTGGAAGEAPGGRPGDTAGEVPRTTGGAADRASGGSAGSAIGSAAVAPAAAPGLPGGPTGAATGAAPGPTEDAPGAAPGPTGAAPGRPSGGAADEAVGERPRAGAAASAGGGYLDLLRARHAARLLGGTLLGRLPNAMAALAVVLFVRSHGAGYGLAGSLSALYGLAVAVGQPLLGRAVDKRGQPRVMAAAALASAAGFALLAACGPRPLAVSVPAVLLAGVATPPLEGGLRALWPDVLDGPARVQKAYALDAAAQEVLFTVGPLLVTAAVATASPAAAVVLTGALGVAGTLVVVTSPPSRGWRALPREAHWLGALRSGGLLALLGAFFFVGVALGAVSLAAVAYGDAHGGGPAAAYVLAANGAGALAGGLWYGARHRPGPPERRLRLLAVGLAACYPPLLLVPALPWMLPLAALSGVFLAPALACGFLVVDRHAPAGTVTEAFSWVVTAIGVGAALGTAAAGAAAQRGGSAAGFGAAAAGGAIALAVLMGTRAFLPAAGNTPRGLSPESDAEKDPNRALDPRFSTSHQA